MYDITRDESSPPDVVRDISMGLAMGTEPWNNCDNCGHAFHYGECQASDDCHCGAATYEKEVIH
jgi:hypothetical protein